MNQRTRTTRYGKGTAHGFPRNQRVKRGRNTLFHGKVRIVLLVGIAVGIANRKGPPEAITIRGVFRRRRIRIERRTAWDRLPEAAAVRPSCNLQIAPRNSLPPCPSRTTRLSLIPGCPSKHRPRRYATNATARKLRPDIPSTYSQHEILGENLFQIHSYRRNSSDISNNFFVSDMVLTSRNPCAMWISTSALWNPSS